MLHVALLECVYNLLNFNISVVDHIKFKNVAMNIYAEKNVKCSVNFIHLNLYFKNV